jgi:hypothetical protein
MHLIIMRACMQHHLVAIPVIAGGLCMPPTGVTNRYEEIMNYQSNQYID